MRYLMITLGFCFLFSCTKHEAALSTEDQAYYDSLDQSHGHFAFIHENDVYYMAQFGEGVVRLTSTPDDTKREVRISHDGSKIAYIDSNEIVNVISIDGAFIDSFHNNDQAIVQMDWTPDDAGLYYVKVGNEIGVHGTEYEMPTPYYSLTFREDADTFQIISLSLSSQGTMAYVVNYAEQKNASYFKNFQEVYTVDATGKFNEIEKHAQAHDFQYVNYSAESEDLVLGYSLNTIDEYYNVRTDRLASLELYPDMEFYGSSETNISTPTYKSDIKTLVAVHKVDNHYRIEKNHFVEDHLTDSKFHEGQFEADTLAGYSSMNPIYIDWK